MKSQITTGRVRFSFLNAFQPRAAAEGATPKYSATLLIPKTDKATTSKIKDAIEAAKAEYVKKNPGKKLPKDIKTTLHDGDGERQSGEDFGPECKGHYVITCSSNRQPVLVYADKTPLTDEDDFYSGCYGRAIINFYVFDVNGNKGITAGLNGLMKLSDGEPLGFARVQDSDWDDEFDDDDEDSFLG